jgi:predicted patatin/cPLA2 family phospholipase
VFFNPIYFDKQYWTDGGVKTIAPLDAAINAGAIEIDVIITGPADSATWMKKKPNTLDVAMRVLDLTYEEILDDDLNIYLKKYPKSKITVLRPAKELPRTSTDFDNKNRIIMEDLGYKEAQAIWP